jgi:hypothetical protein
VTGAEKRVHRRFDLALPMLVRVRTQTAQLLETSTKDISARGLYFQLHGDFELGTELECQVTLPSELCQGTAIQVKCKGRIVRLERGYDDSVGVAATIEDYEFVKAF